MASNGPLAFAIIAWRNSLVFHSPDHVTSLFIHAFPPLLMFAQRWHPVLPGQPAPPYLQCEAPHAGGAGCGSFARTMGASIAFYLVWQAGYFVKTEVLDAHVLRSDPQLQVRK